MEIPPKGRSESGDRGDNVLEFFFGQQTTIVAHRGGVVLPARPDGAVSSGSGELFGNQGILGGDETIQLGEIPRGRTSRAGGGTVGWAKSHGVARVAVAEVEN